MIDIEIGKFCELIEKYKKIILRNNIEENITDLGCQIKTPSGSTTIKYIIKKENLKGRIITLSDKRTVRCADKHILLINNIDVYADELEVGNVIDTNTGPKSIENISSIDDTSFYDIGIEHPHVYYDNQGIAHHNTIITGVLADQASKYGRTITIVPSKDLVVQTEEDFVNMGLDVGVYFGDRKDFGKTHTICTWQGLDALDRKHKKHDESISVTEFLDGVACVIVDECFAPGTKVLTANGYINIEDILTGDKVINYSESSKEFKEDTVVKVHKNLLNSESEKMYLMEFDTGVKLKVTGNHKFLTTRGWVRADDLTEFDTILSHNDR